MNNNIMKTPAQLMQELDDFEESLKLLDILNKKYDELKKELKKEMIRVGTENDLEQLKWITPKGTKITCSIGHHAEFEKQKVKEFDIKILKEKYPQIYEECFTEKETSVMIKNATNDTLRITLAKEEN